MIGKYFPPRFQGKSSRSEVSLVNSTKISLIRDSTVSICSMRLPSTDRWQSFGFSFKSLGWTLAS
jgi:hypothetical protein